ncbi:MAG: queuine tRNA-ribosyltransferase [Methyloligella sp.]|nr:MAG: queuine tRNA-ribosyltransferase [Methyloligella sp.]
MVDHFTYKVSATSGLARRGEISTPKGTIQTPAFMPVGTAATVKGMLPETVRETGADILLGNTYHLMLRPGAERVASLGGLHKFMNWDKPILTDSGGFQVMSLSKLRKITEEGVKFQSHIDGSSYNLTPERSMEIQALLGSDIQMAFDECTPFPATEKQAETSMELSMRWAKRSKDAFAKYSADGQAIFGIVQGGVYEHLRIRSAEALREIEFPGYAVGGLAVGEGQQAMFDTLDFTMPHLPNDKPRYLMGVGTPLDLVGAVERGVDMFDCVMPTRSGRHGQAFTFDGKVNLKNAQFKDDPAPLDEHSSCSAMRDYSKAYLHHLVRSGELLASMLVSWANIHFYQELMSAMRLAIEEDRFAEFAAEFRTRYQASK